MSTPAGPLLVFGPRSTTYDFGSRHPLTPLRFGPGIDLLRSVGAEPGLAPEPAVDAALLGLHRPEYIAAVRRLSADPGGPGEMGLGTSDNPAFAGMHEAGAMVAGGSLAAMEAILRGDAEHAHHPGGGLHHAMAARAWGFCLYNDVALAVVRARAAGLRVLYVDLDVHHGDGVAALTFDDPGVLTVSLHESGRFLFPQTGFPDELGRGAAAGTAVNMPFEPYAGDPSWLPAVRALVPVLGAVFGPDVIVSQHGADAHAWDPLADLRVTTAAMAEAARIVDGVAHRWAEGRWLATGGGGYDAYRVVPRAWALTWLAGAHRHPEAATPPAWRDRWEADAAAFGTPGMPGAFLDPPNCGQPVADGQRTADDRSTATLAQVRAAVLPRLVREAQDRGWWAPSLAWAGERVLAGRAPDRSAPRLRIAPRTIAPFDPADAADLLAAASRAGARIEVHEVDGVVVGVAVAAPSVTEPATESLLALGVAPAHRRRGLGQELLRRLVAGRPPRTAMEARIGVAERDVVEPAALDVRLEAARRLLAGADFELRPTPADIGRFDPSTVIARLSAG
ncbi:MAG: acetoin utilization protein AcuC [Chloroflexota bacterium]